MIDPLEASDAPLLIAGPCVIESVDICRRIAEALRGACERAGFRYVFKASFDKANRSSGSSFRGPGLTDGLLVLERIRSEFDVPVLSDVHEAAQASAAAEALDVLQVPAFLARQTDLLLACGRAGKAVNVKKGQFMSPQEMGNAVEKIRSTGNARILLTERGTFFGYHRLVNDFTGLSVMKGFGCPVLFDVTHSTQQPGGQGHQSGGDPRHSPLLARAAMASGCVDGLFLECHPDPAAARSDAATMLPLDQVEPLLRQCRAIREALRETGAS